MDHIKSLTDSIKESQEREMQRFDKLLNDDIDFHEQEQMEFVKKIFSFACAYVYNFEQGFLSVFKCWKCS